MRSGEADADRAFAVNVDGFRHLIDSCGPACRAPDRLDQLDGRLWAGGRVRGRAGRRAQREVTAHGLWSHQASRRGGRALPWPAASDRDRGLEASARARPRALVPGRCGGADRAAARGQERRGPHDRLPRYGDGSHARGGYGARRGCDARSRIHRVADLQYQRLHGLCERSRAGDRGTAAGAADHARGPAGGHASFR